MVTYNLVFSGGSQQACTKLQSKKHDQAGTKLPKQQRRSSNTGSRSSIQLLYSYKSFQDKFQARQSQQVVYKNHHLWKENFTEKRARLCPARSRSQVQLVAHEVFVNCSKPNQASFYKSEETRKAISSFIPNLRALAPSLISTVSSPEGTHHFRLFTPL